MGERMIPQKLRSAVEKYKFAAIILLIGLVLMLLPGENTQAGTTEESAPQEQVVEDLETRLEALLGKISGAGRVEVLLTVATGEETVYQTDDGSDSRDTVIVEDAQRQEGGLVQRVLAPVYRGAVIACQGADLASVRLAIVEAVSCVTGLRSDQISVVKMD